MQTKKEMPLIASKDLSSLEDRVSQALKSRLSSQKNYDCEEIEKVVSMDPSLFPQNFLLEQKRNEEYRLMARAAQLELKQAREIKSHRKHIGKIIVAIKRASWPLVRIHLKDSVEHMRDFASQALYTMARQEVELARLKVGAIHESPQKS